MSLYRATGCAQSMGQKLPSQASVNEEDEGFEWLPPCHRADSGGCLGRPKFVPHGFVDLR